MNRKQGSNVRPKKQHSAKGTKKHNFLRSSEGTKGGIPKKPPGWLEVSLELERDLTIAELQESGAPMKRLTAIGTQLSLAEAGHRDRLYLELARIFLVARFLEHDDAAWTAICADAIWDEHPKARPKVDDRTSVLSTSLRLAIGLGANQRKRVSVFKRALQGPFERGVAPKEVPLLLREAGAQRP